LLGEVAEEVVKIKERAGAVVEQVVTENYPHKN
jgi:hypothetical protein